jgi:hypothetical protein
MYQLIFVEADPVSYVYTDFDFGICKVYFDGVDLTITDEFWYDYSNKQLTLSGSFAQQQLLHTMYTHRPNLVKKFPNWKVVIDDLGLRELKDMPPSYQSMHVKVDDKIDATKSEPLTIEYVWTGPDGVERKRTKDQSGHWSEGKIAVVDDDYIEDDYYDANGSYINTNISKPLQKAVSTPSFDIGPIKDTSHLAEIIEMYQHLTENSGIHIPNQLKQENFLFGKSGLASHSFLSKELLNSTIKFSNI